MPDDKRPAVRGAGATAVEVQSAIGFVITP
jgi:hypothetical protein